MWRRRSGGRRRCRKTIRQTVYITRDIYELGPNLPKPDPNTKSKYALKPISAKETRADNKML